MNYTVATYPDIGSSSSTNISGGRFTVPVSNLQYFTTYTWTEKVADGTHWTNIAFSFTRVRNLHQP